jgi:cbb3-type cytochrome oxidase subunit 3
MSDLLPFVLWLQHHSVLFVFAVFVLLMASIYWPGRRRRFEDDARIPLEDDAYSPVGNIGDGRRLEE